MRAMRRAAAFACLFATACTASGSDDQTHGPVYGDAGTDATTVSDAAPDHAAGDATSDSASDAADAAGNDAQSASDADASDAAGDDGATDAGLDASDASDAGGCTGVTAVLSGSGSALTGAIAVGHDAFTTQSITGSAGSAPGLAAFGGGFQGLVRESTNALASTAFTSTWSDLAALPGNPAAHDTPALAVVGAALHAVYLGTNFRFYHATFSGNSWDQGGDPVGLPDGGGQAFGPSRAAAAAVGAELVVAYTGNDQHLYVQSWTGGVWATQGTMIGTDTLPTDVPPALVALDGGAYDLLVVYEKSTDTKLYAATRTTQGVWSTPAVVDPNAFTHDAPSLAPVAGAKALVAWRGADTKPYTSAYDAAKGTWTTPAPLVAGSNPNVDAPPVVARGVCGDDAVAAYVSSGAVSVTRLSGASWTTPVTVVASGASVVSLATSP
jgi:hypothetical protein